MATLLCFSHSFWFWHLFWTWICPESFRIGSNQSQKLAIPRSDFSSTHPPWFPPETCHEYWSWNCSCSQTPSANCFPHSSPVLSSSSPPFPSSLAPFNLSSVGYELSSSGSARIASSGNISESLGDSYWRRICHRRGLEFGRKLSIYR